MPLEGFVSIVTSEQLRSAAPDMTAEPTDRLRLANGVRLLGPYQGSGYRETRYLVERGDRQTVLLTRLLYVVATHIAAHTDPHRAAEAVSAELGKQLTPQALTYVVETKLRPLGIVARADQAQPSSAEAAAADPAQRNNSLLSLAMRSTLAPPSLVRVIAAFFAPLFTPAVVVTALAAWIVMDWWLFARWGLHPAMQQVIGRPVLMLVVLALMVLSLAFHECGHAAGCRYSGATPGAIGAGLYLFMPAFYTNVNDAYRLGRGGRLRTDLGGVYFNVVFVVLLAAGYRVTGFAPLAVAAVLSHTEILQQLLPLVRLDGYLILSDLVGVPNLLRMIKPVLAGLLPGRGPDARVTALRPSARAAVTAWALLIVPALLTCQALLLIRLPSIIGSLVRGERAQAAEVATALQTGSLPHFVLGCLSAVILALPVAGLCCIAVRIAAALVRAARKHILRRRATTRAQRTTGDTTRAADPGTPAADPAHPRPAAEPSPGCRPLQRILVLGCAPGAGATTTARVLARTLAAGGAHRVMALDAAHLARNVTRRVHGPHTPATSDTPWWHSCGERYRAVQHDVLSLLHTQHDLIVLDASSRGDAHTIRELLPETQQLVLVTPAANGTRLAEATLDWLEGNGHADLAGQAVVAVTAAPDDAREAHGAPGRHTARCAATVLLPWDATVELEGDPSPERLAAATRQAYTELAVAATRGT